jgi:hypothetical protein
MGAGGEITILGRVYHRIRDVGQISDSPGRPRFLKIREMLFSTHSVVQVQRSLAARKPNRRFLSIRTVQAVF